MESCLCNFLLDGAHLTLCMLGNFASLFLSSADFFKINT